MRGILSTQGQTPPFSPEAEQPKGLLGALSNPDFLDRLAMGLTGMTLNPNQGILASSGQRIKERQDGRKEAQDRAREEERRRAGLDYLRKIGRDDLAQALEAGAITQADAGKIALTPAEAKGQLVTAEQMRAQFPGTEIEDGLYNLKPDGTASKVGGGGTTVNAQANPAPPSGYRNVFDENNNLLYQEVVPGGPADREIKAAEAEAAAIAKKQGGITEVKESIVSRDVDRLIGMIDKRGLFDLPEAGIVGAALGNLGINQEAVTFKNTLAGIQATVAFDRLQQMREASKTGGALGAVSERELDLLISAYGALQQSTDAKTLKENLLTIKEIMTKIENDPIASQAYFGGAGAGAEPANDGFSVTGRVD